MAGGGAFGKAVGITHGITIEAGFTTTGFQASISIWILIGGDTTETVTGTVTDGIMKGFPTDAFKRIGVSGTRIVTGKNKELGASKDTNLDTTLRCRNSRIKGENNITRGLMYSVISNSCTICGCKGSKYSPKFKTPEGTDDKYKSNSGNRNQDNPGFKDPKESDSNSKSGENHNRHNPRVSNLMDLSREEDCNGNSLKEDLTEGISNRETKLINRFETSQA